MKTIHCLIALALAGPLPVWSQEGVATQDPGARAPLATIEANVARIEFAPERERWQANLDLWKIRLAKNGTLEKGDVDRMALPFAIMQANVSRLMEPREKERWMANRDMWQMVLGMSGTPAGSEPATMKSAFSKMQANVGAITEPEEKQRWTANVALWREFIAKM